MAGERCSKPGCGAQAIIGRRCTDWDCPKATVSADHYRALLARAERAEAELQRMKEGAALVSAFLRYLGKPGHLEAERGACIHRGKDISYDSGD